MKVLSEKLAENEGVLAEFEVSNRNLESLLKFCREEEGVSEGLENSLEGYKRLEEQTDGIYQKTVEKTQELLEEKIKELEERVRRAEEEGRREKEGGRRRE